MAVYTETKTYRTRAHMGMPPICSPFCCVPLFRIDKPMDTHLFSFSIYCES